jgi:hypothetical protein
MSLGRGGSVAVDEWDTWGREAPSEPVPSILGGRAYSRADIGLTVSGYGLQVPQVRRARLRPSRFHPSWEREAPSELIMGCLSRIASSAGQEGEAPSEPVSSILGGRAYSRADIGLPVSIYGLQVPPPGSARLRPSYSGSEGRPRESGRPSRHEQDPALKTPCAERPSYPILLLEKEEKLWSLAPTTKVRCP